MKTAPDEVRRIFYDDLVQLLTRVFARAGLSEPNATILAANCAACERDGSLSHGIFRIPGYVNALKSGWVDGNAIPVIEDCGPSFIRVDAKNTFAQIALKAAKERITERVNQTGVVVVAIRDSQHFSAVWPDLEPFAERGLVVLSVVSGLACVAPPGGKSAVFGTNPIGFATPVKDAPPLIFDFATSAMSNGDLRLAARAGERVALGTGVDGEGQLTTDPNIILREGALLPFGDHKGAALAFMVEVLASALTGGQFSSEVDFSSHPGAEIPRTGQLFILVEPTRGGNTAFSSRVEGLINAIRNAGATRLPSDRRYQNRSQANRYGIPISSEKYAALLAMAAP